MRGSYFEADLNYLFYEILSVDRLARVNCFLERMYGGSPYSIRYVTTSVSAATLDPKTHRN